MAALFQLVPVVPVGIAPMGGGGYSSPLGGFDAMNRLGDPFGGVAAPQMMPGMGFGVDPAQAMMTQLVGMLARLLLGQASGQSPAGSTCTPSADTSSSSSSGSSPADASQFSGGTDAGRKLAAAAQNEAQSENTTGYCFRGVSRALKTMGIETHGASAYMAADQLASNPKVKEIKVDKSQLKSLPPGAIVVWAQSPGHPHGHISVALGNGKEASDHVQNQIGDLGGSFRVFMPV